MIAKRRGLPATRNFKHLQNLRTRVRDLVPAALHQYPQLVCELLVCGSWRALPSHYDQHSRCGEQQVDGGASFVSCLDHDHRERKNVRFLAVRSLLLQYLWCGPSRGMTLIFRGASDGIQVLSDRGKAEIRDPCMVGVIHEDIRLLRVKTVAKQGIHRSRTPLRSPWTTLREWRK